MSTSTPGSTSGGLPATSVPATSAKPDGWSVDTSKCSDPTAADAPIHGTVKVGSVMPLSSRILAAAFGPVKDGFEAYIKYANDKKLLGDLTIESTIEDDQYDPALTPKAVSTQIDAGVNLFSGIIGTANNIAVRDSLNAACIPQLNALTGSPAWGDVANHPWTTGILVPYTVEAKVYAKQLSEMHPNGASVALFAVDDEFGRAYVDAFTSVAERYHLTIVDEQVVGENDPASPVSQVASIAAQRPDGILAVPRGPGCDTFLGALADAKAQNLGWTPATFVTSACASSLILGAAGPAADGLYTSSNLKDISSPANASDPKVKEYLDYMNAQGLSDVATAAAAGWTTAEVTIAIIKQASQSPEGLSRASIIRAARNFTFTPMLARDGVVDTSKGEDDPFLAESLQVVQYDADTATFTDVGSLITEFES